MQKLFLLVVWVFLMAYIAATRYRTRSLAVVKPLNLFNILLMLPLIGLLGLRTAYNDTGTYIAGFQNAETLSTFFSNAKNYDLLNNPLFNLYTSAVRTATDNYHIYFMLAAIFVVVLMVTFFCRISECDTYPLTIYTYLTLGTYFFALAAMKQTIAMAILCHSVLALRDRKHLRFLLLVLLAGLFHTYAWFFLVLLLLTGKPWKLRTFLVVAVTIFVMLTFNNSISALLEYAGEAGKGASEEAVFSGEGMNLFRVAVYSIVPVVSLVFRRILEPQMERKHYIMLHMSIVSFMFMLLASINGANMFGRMARYFEVGTIYMFPWMLRHLFNQRSQIMVVVAYIGAFGLFAAYQYIGFDTSYHSITFFEFLRSLV